jgi:hypothetical protein
MARTSRTATGFLDPIETLQYPGSSGRWATSGTNSPSREYLPGLGYAGDAARARMGGSTRPGNSAWWNPAATPTGTGFTSLVQPKFPGAGYEDAITGLMNDLKSNSALPDYKQTLSAVTSANKDLPGAFDKYQGALNIDDYAAGQRGLNPAFENLTAGYSDTARGIGTRYGQTVQDYTGAGGAVLDANLENARQFRDTEIPASIADALGTVGKNLKLYDFANPGGYNSAIPAIGGREAVRATLPFRLEANRNYGNALMARLPFLGDVASRNASLAGFNLGNESNIYGQQQGDIIRRQQTEDKIQNLKVQTAGLSLEAAIRKAPTLAAGAYELSRLYNLPVEDIMRRAQALGVVLGLQGQANYTGVEQNGGANVVEPQYFNNMGLPSRYGNTRTATNGNAQQGTGPNATGWQDWNANQPQQAAAAARNYLYTPEGRQDYYDTYGNPAPITSRYAGGGGNTGGGWGYVNGQYIGAGAGAWNAGTGGTDSWNEGRLET